MCPPAGDVKKTATVSPLDFGPGAVSTRVRGVNAAIHGGDSSSRGALGRHSAWLLSQL